MVKVAPPKNVPSPHPERKDKLPKHKDEITTQWLTQTFQYCYPNVVVEAMEELEFIDSHTSKLRLKLTLNQAGIDAGIPEQVCLKANFSGGFDDVDINKLEAQFYYFARGNMATPTPQCYYADWEGDDSGVGLIILEDLTTLGGSFGNSRDDAGVDAIAKLLDQLAQLHADLWGSPLLDQWEWLPTSMATPVDNNQIRIMQKWIDLNLANPKYQAILPQAYMDDPERLQRAFDALAEWEHAQTTPKCINVGDCHQGNTYVKPNGERMWLDWQLVRKGSPWRDLTYLMVGALTIEERRASERDLLKQYREALIRHGAEGVPDLDTIFEQYRRWVIYGIQAWIANLDDWGQPGFHMNERFFTAGEDLGTWKALLGD